MNGATVRIDAIHDGHTIIRRRQDGATFDSLQRVYGLASGAERHLPEEHNAMGGALHHKVVQLDFDEGAHEAEIRRPIRALREYSRPHG